MSFILIFLKIQTKNNESPIFYFPHNRERHKHISALKVAGNYFNLPRRKIGENAIVTHLFKPHKNDGSIYFSKQRAPLDMILNELEKFNTYCLFEYF